MSLKTNKNFREFEIHEKTETLEQAMSMSFQRNICLLCRSKLFVATSKWKSSSDVFVFIQNYLKWLCNVFAEIIFFVSYVQALCYYHFLMSSNEIHSVQIQTRFNRFIEGAPSSPIWVLCFEPRILSWVLTHTCLGMNFWELARGCVQRSPLSFASACSVYVHTVGY